jgi:hypothetical protein
MKDERACHRADVTSLLRTMIDRRTKSVFPWRIFSWSWQVFHRYLGKACELLPDTGGSPIDTAATRKRPGYDTYSLLGTAYHGDGDALTAHRKGKFTSFQKRPGKSGREKARVRAEAGKPSQLDLPGSAVFGSHLLRKAQRQRNFKIHHRGQPLHCRFPLLSRRRATFAFLPPSSSHDLLFSCSHTNPRDRSAHPSLLLRNNPSTNVIPGPTSIVHTKFPNR